MRKRIVVMALAAGSAMAQTQIDLRTQAKSVDFSAAGSTKPLKTGTTLPGTCTVGEVFFKTPAPSGANLYACATQNAWTVQGGITSQNCWADAVTNLLKCQDSQGNVYAVVQTAASGTANQWVDYISASGTPHTSRPTAAAVGAVADPGSNGIIYRNGSGTSLPATVDQLSGPFFCQDAGSSGAYQCNLSPAPGGYATGSTYWFKANTGNSGAASINFNGLGAKTIKKLASQDLAAGDIKAGQWVLVTYDGTNMQMQNQTGSAMQTNQSNTITAGTQDFSGAAHTLPMKSGTLATRPATCTVGETYFATDATAGSNVYGCTAVNTWSAQASSAGALTVENFGVAVGARPTINIIPGQGLSSILTDTGSKVNIQLGLDSAVMQTQTVAQSGSFLLCASSGGSAATYRCSLNPTAALYTTGMTLRWIPDVGGAGGVTTLNVDTLGAIPVKMADGATDPSATDIVAGRLYSIWYDGTHFRMPSTQTAGLSDPGSSGVVYRSGLNTTTAATGHSIAAPLTCIAASGSGTTYSCTTVPAFTPAAGDTLMFKADVANTGAATLSVNGAGAKALRKQGGSTSLAANDLLAGHWADLIFDGSNWQMQGQTGNAAGGNTITSPNGTLNTGGTSSNTTLDVKTTVIGQKFFGTAPPGSIAGNLPGDTFNDTTNHNVYTCNAPSGTAAPACTAVTSGGWMPGSGSSMVYPGAGVAVSSGSGWSTSVAISASPGANTIPKTDNNGVLNVPAGFASAGPFAATGATQAKPAAPASGSLTEWFDATLGIPQWENSAGAIVATSVVPASGATANQWVDYIPGSGTPHTSQPAFSNLSGAATLAQLPTTAIAQKFFGTAAPGSAAGNLPGDLFTDTTNHHLYVCNAPSGTAAPACTSVATTGWLQVDGAGGGGDNITSPNSTLTVGGTSTNTTLDVATTKIPQKFFGTSAPGSVAGNLPGDTFNDTNGHNIYTCNAPSGTAAPACTSVTTGGWTITGGGSTAFSAVTTGTSTGQTFTLGAGSSIVLSGGTNDASSIKGQSVLDSLTALGDIYVSNVLGQIRKLSTGGAGNDGKVLTLDSTQTLGVKWASGSGTGPSTNQNIRRIPFFFDGGGSALTGTTTRCNNVAFGGTINQFALVGDASGSATITIKQVALGAGYTGEAGFSGYTAVGTESPSSVAYVADSTLTGFTTSLAANSVVCVQLSNPSTYKWISAEIKVAAN